MNDLFNSIGNDLHDALSSLDLSIHDKIKDTVVDDFIHELKNYLFKSDPHIDYLNCLKIHCLKLMKLKRIILNVIIIMKDLIFQKK